MDIQARVAARRRQIERQKAEEQAERLAAHAASRTEALDGLAAGLTVSSGVDIERQGDRVGFARVSTLKDVDPAAFKRGELRRMLVREARLEFSIGENVVAIAGIAVGLTLLVVGRLDAGAIVLFVAIVAGLSFIDKHKKRLTAEYPQLFGPYAGIAEPPPLEEGDTP